MVEEEQRYEFVELNRTFHELSKYARESDNTDLTQAFHVGKRLDWSDLTQEYRVVILSEAGSGKTAEIRNIAQNLRTEGKPAFFIRLEHIPNDLEDAFEVGDFEQFEQWIASSDEGWLLLDSVDEARLRNPGDFELAIRKLGRRISTAKDRAHIVITGRTAAWRPKTDLTHCTQHLPFTPRTTKLANTAEPEEDEDPESSLRTTDQDKGQDATFKLVALDDLSSDQIKQFAQSRGITDTT